MHKTYKSLSGRMQPLLVLLFLVGLASAQTTIYMPASTGQVVAILSGSGSSPTVLTTRENLASSGYANGDTVILYGIVENNGTANIVSSLNAPAGSARKITNLTATTFQVTDLAGNPVNTSNAILINGGTMRKAVASTLNLGPRVGFGGTGSCSLVQFAATIPNGQLTNITVSGSTATINYAYPHCLTGNGNKVQVRNASATALNGAQTVTVASTTSLTFTTTAGAGTYTDANLSVSARALDGDPGWERVKYLVNHQATTDQTNPASLSAAIWNMWAAAAEWWYVDPSQTTLLTNTVYEYEHFEDFFAAPEMCGSSNGPYCNFGSPLNSPRLASSDYLRMNVPNFMLGYSLIRSQLTPTDRTNIANYFLNDVDTSCTSNATPVQGAGTITYSAGTVTGTGTSFTSYSPGDYLFEFVGNNDYFCRIKSIASDTSLTCTTGASFSASAASYYRSAPFSAGNCGVRWFYAHHGASDALRDARLYVLPYVTGDQSTLSWPVSGSYNDFNYVAGNNQSMSAGVATLSIGSALAEDDSRALGLLQNEAEFYLDFNAAERLGTWGGLSVSGPNYSQERSWWESLYGSLIAQNSIASFPDTITNTIAPGQVAYQIIYSWLPATLTSDPVGVPYSDNWNGDYISGDVHRGFSLNYILGAAYGTAAAGDFNYWLNNYNTAWSTTPGGGNYYYESPLMMPIYNPNQAAATNFTTRPLQVDLAGTDSAKCSGMGLRCADTTNAFYPNSSARRASIVSRTSWTAPATVILQSNVGQMQAGSQGSVNDHAGFIPGNYHIVRSVSGDSGSNALKGCLVGDNDGNCTFGESAGYGHNSLYQNNTALDAGANPTSGSGASPIDFGANLTRWSGADQFGDSASRFVSNCWDLSSYYTGVTTAQRCATEFKKSGDDQFFITYDDVARSSGYAIAGFTQYPQGAPTGCCTGGTTAFSGGLLTSTSTNGSRVMTQWLAPAGPTTLAVFNDGTTGYGGVTGAYRLRHAASTDGSTANASATSMEALEVHYITTSANSSFSTSLISPDANWTCAQMTGATNTDIACFARGGTTQGAPTDFTATFTGTAQVHFSGLTPASYPVKANGSTVTTCNVSSGDNGCYAEIAGAGATTISLGGAVSGTLAVSPSSLSFSCTAGGANPAGQSVAVSATGVTLDNWTATKGQSWLSLSPTSGSTAGNFTASVNCAGLTAGSYSDTISVASTTGGISNSPQTVAVSLTVSPAGSSGGVAIGGKVSVSGTVH